MTRIKRSLSSFLTSICSSLLTLLGYSCSSSPDDPHYICMYGIPTGDFEIKGSVTTEEGKLEADSVIVKLHYDKDKADSWYVGFAKETVNFKLKSKVPEKVSMSASDTDRNTNWKSGINLPSSSEIL